MKKYYSGLDLVRFFAAIAVAFFYHYVIALGPSPLSGNTVADFLNKYGGYVVELFFVISGFVMYMAYSTRIRDGKTVFTKYLTDRIIRLFPALVITVIVAIIPMWIGYGLWDEPVSVDSGATLTAIAFNLFGLNGGTAIDQFFNISVNGPTWYISVLMVCYILFYGIIKLCRGSKGAENVGFSFVLLIGVFIYMYPINAPFLFVNCARGYIYFFIGVFLAQLQSKIGKIGSIVVCVISIGMVLMFYFANQHDLFMNESLEIGLFLVCPVVMFFTNFFPLEYICNNVVVRFLGGISFGIFLWNMPVFIWVRFVEKCSGSQLQYDNIFTYLIIVGINLAVGILSYILIDKLLVKFLKNRQTKKAEEDS